DGCYTIEYNKANIELAISYTGYQMKTVPSQANKELITVLEMSDMTLDELVVTGRSSKKDRRKRRSERSAPAAIPSTPASPSFSISSEEISAMPIRSIDAVKATTAGLRSEEGASPSIRGSRSDATEYYVDGVRIPTDDASPPSPEVEDYEIAEELPEAGQLTAGEVNDFGKWDMWHDISQEDLARHREVWGIYPDNRFAAQLTFSNGQPAVDVSVKLVTSGGKVLWHSRTDNQGRAELWRGMYDPTDGQQDRLRLVAHYNGKDYRFASAQGINEGVNFLTIEQPCDQAKVVDISFVVDATGSMGDEIRYLSSELLDVMARAEDSLKGQELRLSTVFYRDEGDDY
ncbi:MAG: TonB-dependent receptor plug domain-containing protein, partial [Bacteroidota bacterium]